MMTAGINHSEYLLRFSRRASKISITVFPGRVSVIAPVGVKRRDIDTFVRYRSDWINEKLAFYESCKGPSSMVDFKDKAPLWLFGREVHLKMTDSGNNPILRNDRLLVENGFSEKKFLKWLDEQLLTKTVSYSDRYSKLTGLNPLRIRIGGARTRWGSCSVKGVLMMNRKLVHAPLDVIEYVFVHELVHLRYRNHSRLFWSAVEQYLGDVKPQKKWLRLQGAHLL